MQFVGFNESTVGNVAAGMGGDRGESVGELERILSGDSLEDSLNAHNQH